MNDPLLVRRFQGFRDLLGDRQRLVNRNRALRDAVGERCPLDELHHEGTDAARFLETVNVGDIRVVQRGECVRFSCEPRQPIGITGEGVGKDLECHVAIELRVVGPVYLSHPSFADLSGDFVDAEAYAGCEGQQLWIISVGQQDGGDYSRVTL